MSAQPVEGEPYERVPASRLRHLEAIESAATPEVMAEAGEIEAGDDAARAERARGASERLSAIAATADHAKTGRMLAHLLAQRDRLPEARR